MKIMINNEEYNVVIDKKISTKNIYIRVKENLDIYVTCNILTSNKFIVNLINDNKSRILKMINIRKKKLAKDEYFYYLCKK
jgi:predicted metal-dependent hydrolase